VDRIALILSEADDILDFFFEKGKGKNQRKTNKKKRIIKTNVYYRNPTNPQTNSPFFFFSPKMKVNPQIKSNAKKMGTLFSTQSRDQYTGI
jgi:hypothetical protein